MPQMRIVIELPEDFDVESVNLRDLWCDAIYEFATRREDAYDYVANRYVSMDDGFKERKEKEVAMRSRVARRLHANGIFRVEE